MSNDGPIGGRFEVLAQLGSGSFGRVFLCTDRELDLEVAVKILHKELVDEPDYVAMFTREARWLSQDLSCPDIITIGHFGFHQNRPFFAMPFADRGTIQDYRHRIVAESSINTRVQLARQVSACLQGALTALHQREKQHRDIKPANILVKSTDPGRHRTEDSLPLADDHLMVADLGLVRDQTHDTLILPGQGTIDYMAPETYGDGFDADLIGSASDLYSSTMVVIFCLTGQPARGTWQQSLRRLSLSDDLIAALEQGLSPDPASRFQSAQMWGDEMATHLRTYRKPSIRRAPTPLPTTAAPAPVVIPARRPGPLRRSVTAVSRLVIGILATIGFAFLLLVGVNEAFNGSIFDRFLDDGIGIATTQDTEADAAAEPGGPATGPDDSDTSDTSDDDRDTDVDPSTTSTAEPPTISTEPTFNDSGSEEATSDTDSGGGEDRSRQIEDDVATVLEGTRFTAELVELDNGGMQVWLEGKAIDEPGIVGPIANEVGKIEGVYDVQTSRVSTTYDFEPGINLGELLELGTITFGYLGSELADDSEAATALTEIADLLATDTDVLAIEVAGFTDSSGTAAKNRDVSLQRATAATAFLNAKGVPASMIRTVGYGSACPIPGAANQAQRRVEIVVVATTASPDANAAACQD